MKYIIFQFLLLTTIASFGQGHTSRVLARNAGAVNNRQTIWVKWYSSELYYPEGVNIYRKQGNGEWLKLNAQPLKKLNDVPPAEYAKDKDLNFFVPAINKGKKEDLKGFLFLNVLAKSFESQVFASFLGIMYKDSTVTSGVSYTYKVNKLKGNNEVLVAISPTITSGKETIEEPVREVSLVVDTNKVKLRWMPEDQKYYGVNIYREGQGKELQKLNKEPLMLSKIKDSLGQYQYPKIFYVDDSLNPGVYTYQLAGIDFFGVETKRTESFRAEVKDLIPPPSPEALQDSIRNLDVSLTWTIEASKDIAGINVFRSTKSTGPFLKINPSVLSPGTRSFLDKVLKSGPYYYYVSTVDGSGNEGRSETIFSEVHDMVPPSKPLGLVAKADTGKVVLTWQKNKEGDIFGYRIFRTVNKNEKSKFVLINSNPIKENQFVDRLPRNAKNKFLYKIIALDTSFNKSEASDIVTVQIPDVTPPVIPYIKSLKAINNSLVVEWIPNKDLDLMGYELYRAIGRAAFGRVNEKALTSKELSFTDTKVVSNTRYDYYLVAIDSAGNKSQPSSTWNGILNASISKNAISDLKIKYQSGKKAVNISWDLEQKQELLGYVIYRREGEKGIYAPVSEKVFKTGFTDRNVQQAKTYYYEIRGYDKTGNIIKSAIAKIQI